MRYEKTVVDSYPAYDVILPRKCTMTDYPVFKDGDEIAVWFGGRSYKIFTFGSVASYALEYNDDPIEAYSDAVEKGHSTHWLNANCIVLSSNKEAKKEYYLVKLGDKVLFEGVVFLVDEVFNNNLELVKIGSKKEILDARWNAG